MPATMCSVRAALRIAALQGHNPKVSDANQAYNQARIDGSDRPRTWARLPRQWWPAIRFDVSGKPFCEDTEVSLVRALWRYMDTQNRAPCDIHTFMRFGLTKTIFRWFNQQGDSSRQGGPCRRPSIGGRQA